MGEWPNQEEETGFQNLASCGHGPRFSGWLKATAYKKMDDTSNKRRNINRLFN